MNIENSVLGYCDGEMISLIIDLEKVLGREGALDALHKLNESLLKPRRICINCEFFSKKFKQCRRNPPLKSGWPGVLQDDFCGEFRSNS